MKVNEDLTPLGDSPFGEQVDLSTGGLSFEQSDIVLKGTGPDIVIARSIAQTSGSSGANPLYSEFGNWRLDIPRITAITTGTESATAISGIWTVGTEASFNRCSQMGEGIYLDLNQGTLQGVIHPNGWSQGLKLVLPGQGEQDILVRSNSTLSPTMNGPSGAPMTFNAFTTSHWMIGCLPQTQSGDPGEGFFVVGPDGTTYQMDWLKYTWSGDVVDPDFVPIGTQRPIEILSVYAQALVTRAQDRFGNWVNYNYSGGQLISISASDGRNVAVSWRSDAPFIDHITVTDGAGNSRTWTYGYTGVGTLQGNSLLYQGQLSSLSLPDGSSWQFNLGPLLGATPGSDIDTTVPFYCQGGYFSTNFPNSTGTGSITHPSGLVGTFTVHAGFRTRVGRPRPPSACPSHPPPLFEAAEYWTEMLTSKTFTGAGVNQSWSYSYASPPVYWADQCPNGVCPQHTMTTDVIDPSGNTTRYSFDNTFDTYMEGKLVSTMYGFNATSGSFLRQETRTYADPNSGGPFNNPIGTTMDWLVNIAQHDNLSPVSVIQTTEEGDLYTWQVLAFNAFAQPTDVKRYSSVAGQSAIEETTAYLNDPAFWVIGLPQQVTNVGTGEVETLNSFNSNDALQSRSRFGQLLMSYGYDAQGNLASFTDPNNHATNLSNYRLGIPQTVTYPDGHGESLVVDGFGQISSITDQAGNTTSYSYDAIGRIAGITYPAGDEVAWAPKTFSYALVPNAERGIAANHWRRITTQGNAVSTTYFDAMLEPVLSDAGIAGQASASTTRTDYDWKGQKTFVSYPGSASPDITALTTGTHSVYDALERLTDTQQDSELGTLTTHTAYLSGARQQVTDPKSNVTTTAYQVFDQPVYQSVIQVQAPGGITQTISRDIYGNPLSITQSGLYGTETDTVTKTLTYDSFHRLCRTTEPESGSEVTAYDAANNIAWTASGLSITGTGCGQEQVADAAKTNRSYDAMNRVLTLVPPSGTQSTTYTYDPLGNVQTSASGIATWTAGRNKLAQLTSETLNVTGNGSNVLRYSHDANGHVATISYPDGLVVNYAPDALGRPTQAGSFASNLSYFPDGDIEHFTFGNGADYLVQKNARQLLSNFSYAKGSTLNLSEDFVYDPNGNITNINDLAGGPRTKSFGYDALNRLTSAQATGLWGTETYSYDPLNNIRSRVSDGQTYSYNYDATNRLASITNGSTTAFSFGYDNRGNVTTKNTTSLVFDQKNQLTQIPGLDSYAYDASGRRVLKTPTSGNPTYYFYTQDGQLLYQFEANTTKSTDYIFLGKKLIARNEGYNTSVIGNVDSVNIDGSGNATVSGWACSTGLAASINVEVFAGGPSGGGGTRVATGTANQASEPAVATACQTSGTTYRFSIPLTTAIRSQYAGTLIYMYGDSPVGNGNLVLNGSGILQVPAAPTAPAAPASATATVASDLSSLTVTWSSSATATSYVLQQKQNSNPWNQILNSNVTSYTLSNPVDASYSYQVQACNASGCSAFKASNTVSVAHLPTTPASISAPGSSTGTIGISWAAATYATSYTLEQSINGGAYAAIYSGAATSNSFSVEATGSYTYRVKACNANGCSGYVTSGAIAVTIPPASAPSISVPGTSNTGSYTVTWSGVAGATSYLLQEQVNGGGWTTIQNANATSWAASGKGNGTYGYQVQGCNAGGCGPWSGTASIVVALVPDVPTGFTKTLSGNAKNVNEILSWTAVPGATSYQAENRETGAIIYNGTATQFIWASAPPSKPLSPPLTDVRACNASGCSAWGFVQ